MVSVPEVGLVLAALVATVSGYFVSIDAHAEECFYERVNSGTKMGLMFEVAEGGFLDIDVEVRGTGSGFGFELWLRVPNLGSGLEFQIQVLG